MALITPEALMHLDPWTVYELLTFWLNDRSPIHLRGVVNNNVNSMQVVGACHLLCFADQGSHPVDSAYTSASQ